MIASHAILAKRPLLPALAPERIRRGSRRTIAAFTLIELLVVIAIISVLVSLLLPALSLAKESARNAHCKSNLHQLSVAFLIYSDDFRGFLPPTGPAAGTWPGYQPNVAVNNWAIPVADGLRSAYFRQASAGNADAHERTALSFNCPAVIQRSDYGREDIWRSDDWDPNNRHTSYQSMTSVMVNPMLAPGFVKPDLSGNLVNFQVLRIEDGGNKLMLGDQTQFLKGSGWISNHLKPHGANQARVDGSVTRKAWAAMKLEYGDLDRFQGTYSWRPDWPQWW